MALIPVYTTRAAVKRAIDSAETARNNTQVDRAIRAGARNIDGMCHRRFYPELRTSYYDWPSGQFAPSWRLWLDGNELISVTGLVAGGVTIASSDYILTRSDGRTEPPYSKIEVLLSSSAFFQAGATHQQAIAVTGWHGHSDNQETAGALAEDLDSAETGVDVTAAGGAVLDAGSLIVVGTERMIVTDKQLLDTTVNLGADLAASSATTGVTVADGTVFAVGETLSIDTERLLVVDIAGNTLIVERGFDGSALAAHTTGADIYARRRLVVERGSVGSTAAAHSTAATVYQWLPPAPVQDLNTAEALVTLVGESAAYATKPGTQGGPPAGGSIGDVRERVCEQYGRRGRIEAI